MSSMLKKTGGLAFKPKVGRRPGAASASASASASQAPASQSTTRAPTSEPAQPPAPTSIHTVPVPAVSDGASAPGIPKELPPTNLAEVQTNIPKESTPSATQPPRPAEPTTAVTQQATPNSQTSTTSAQPTVSKQNASIGNIPADPNAGPTETVPVATPVTGVEPPQPSGSILPDAASRHPLPQSTTQEQPSVTGATKETPSSSTTITPVAGLPSPAITAISQSSVVPGRALSSPSPFPASEIASSTAPLAQPQGNGPAAAHSSTEALPKKRQYRRRKPTEGGEAGDATGDAAPPKPKRPRKRKAPAVAEGQEGEAAASSEAAPTGPKRIRRRNITPDPEDIPEDGRPDHTTTKIGDLTKDLGIGKKFKHADLILERQRQARHDAKLHKLEKQKRAMGLLPTEENQADGSRVGTPAGDEGVNADSGARLNRGQGIDFDIIDGQIMINQSSLVINQHAAEGDIQLETVEEDEFTHLTTSASYMRPSRAMGTNHWDDEDTEKFYRYLKMFGTDFETISHMFPGRNRRQVKLKFNREERLRPNRVNAAIMARGEKRVTIDLEDYKANRSGFDDTWITKDKFQAEQEQLRREQERELEAKRQERRDLGLLDDDPGLSKTGTDGDQKVGEGGEEEVDEEIIDEADVGGATVAVAA